MIMDPAEMLNDDVLERIFAFLSYADLVAAELTCKVQRESDLNIYIC